MRLPDPQRSCAVLIGTSKYADGKLPDLPVIGKTIRDLAATLTDPIYGVVAKDHCAVLKDQGDIRLIGRRLRSAASHAEDLLLVYFVGHGLVSDRRHDLYLGLPDSESADPAFNSLEYDKLRSCVLDSRAATKIIILDCCFSGRVVGGAMADPVTEMIGQIEVKGTYVLTSAGRDQVALIRPGEDHTAFTGRFLNLIRDGVPGGPELLTVDYLYQQLVNRMKAEGLPQPQKRSTATADLLALARNRAFTATRQEAARPTIMPVPLPESLRTGAARTLTGHADSVLDVAFSPSGRLLATSSRDKTARLWDPATGDCQRTLTGHVDTVQGVAFSPDGGLLATAGWDGTARVWDPATGNCRRSLTGHTDMFLHRVAFSPGGRLLATTSSDMTARLWDPVRGKRLRELAGHTSTVEDVAFSPDGRLLATASSDRTVRVWDPATGDCQRTLTGHTSIVEGVAFSPDGRLLATASSDGTVRVWDPATGDCLRIITGHTKMIHTVAFSPDGRLLATANFDRAVQVWGAARGDCLRTLTGHTDMIHRVAFSPSGRLLATASSDKTARVWDWT